MSFGISGAGVPVASSSTIIPTMLRSFPSPSPPLEISTSINIVPRVSISRMPAIKTESRLPSSFPPQLRSPTWEELVLLLCRETLSSPILHAETRVSEKIAAFRFESKSFRGRAEPNPGLVGYKLASFPPVNLSSHRRSNRGNNNIRIGGRREREREREGRMDIRGWIEVNPRGIVGRVLLSSTFFALDLQVEAELRFSKPLAPPLNESLSLLFMRGKGDFMGKEHLLARTSVPRLTIELNQRSVSAKHRSQYRACAYVLMHRNSLFLLSLARSLASPFIPSKRRAA